MTAFAIMFSSLVLWSILMAARQSTSSRDIDYDPAEYPWDDKDLKKNWGDPVDDPDHMGRL